MLKYQEIQAFSRGLIRNISYLSRSTSSGRWAESDLTRWQAWNIDYYCEYLMQTKIFKGLIEMHWYMFENLLCHMEFKTGFVKNSLTTIQWIWHFFFQFHNDKGICKPLKRRFYNKIKIKNLEQLSLAPTHVNAEVHETFRQSKRCKGVKFISLKNF